MLQNSLAGLKTVVSNTRNATVEKENRKLPSLLAKFRRLVWRLISCGARIGPSFFGVSFKQRKSCTGQTSRESRAICGMPGSLPSSWRGWANTHTLFLSLSLAQSLSKTFVWLLPYSTYRKVQTTCYSSPVYERVKTDRRATTRVCAQRYHLSGGT